MYKVIHHDRDKFSSGLKQMIFCLHSKESKYMCYNFTNWHYKNQTNSTKLSKYENQIYLIWKKINFTLAFREHHGHDCIVVRFKTTRAISAYHHLESRTCCVKFCQWLAAGRWFSPVSSTNKSNCYDITEILLKVALNTIYVYIYIYSNIKK